jgi:hypothetical protein
MSLRVLRVEPGTPYHHSYLDDLESFFWLIFWCATAHTDSADHYPTSKAQRMLTKLNHGDLETMAFVKRGLLTDCSQARGIEMRKMLDSFANTWALDPIIRSVILELGRFFHKTYDNPDESRSPPKDFLKVVCTIQDALSAAA